MESNTSKVDLHEAQRMLDGGKSVREIAVSFGASTQAVYELIKKGRLERPVETAAVSG